MKSWVAMVEAAFPSLTPPSLPLSNSSSLLLPRSLSLPEGANYVFSKKCLKGMEGNSAIFSYFQSGKVNIKEFLILEVLNAVLYQKAFTQLRTVEQLGYIVSTGHRAYMGISYSPNPLTFIYREYHLLLLSFLLLFLMPPMIGSDGLVFVIQSTVKGPNYLDGRVEAFLEEVWRRDLSYLPPSLLPFLPSSLPPSLPPFSLPSPSLPSLTPSLHPGPSLPSLPRSLPPSV